MAANPMPDEFTHSFRDGVGDPPLLRLTGPAARRVARPDGQGLTISRLATRADPSGAIAVGPAFTLRGDCEATRGSDALSTDGAIRPAGAGIHFTATVDGPEYLAISVTRSRKPAPDGQALPETFGANPITRGADGKETYRTKTVPAAATGPARPDLPAGGADHDSG